MAYFLQNNYVKGFFVFFVLAISLLSMAGLANADTITLPNPLCPRGATNCIDSFPKLIAEILKAISAIVGGLATIMLVWAGILYVVSGGDPGKAAKAKQAAIYAIIGLAIALAGAGLQGVITSVVTSGL